MKSLYYLITLALLGATLAGCGKPTLPPSGFAAKAELSPDSLRIGDVVTLTLTARHPAGSVVKFPTLGRNNEVVVRGRAVDTTVLTEEVLETEEIFQLTSLRVGNWLITSDPAVCILADGSEKAQALPEITLLVETLLNEDNKNKLSDIKGSVRQLSRVVWVTLLIIVIAVLAGVITLYFMKNPKAIIGSEPIIPPHVKARMSLSDLKETAWEPEPFFVELSLILRTYLEDRFELNAPESTTEEMAHKLKQDPSLTGKNSATLQQFFTQADLVKFAQADAKQDVMQSAFDTVEQFVSQTEPREDLPQESAKNSKKEAI
jgi:hypothetical protein